jgi:hypothetical protein
MDDMLERLRIRLPDTPLPEEALKEYLNTVSDRLCLRLGVEMLPSLFQSICVDATVKMYRRTYYEGISTEGVANISTSFVDDILAEYAQEIGDWKSSQAANGNSNKVVRFL